MININPSSAKQDCSRQHCNFNIFCEASARQRIHMKCQALLHPFVKVLCRSLTTPGPSCSKLTMSLVNDSLKFRSSDTCIC